MVVKRNEKTVFAQVKEAKNFWQRFKGLMGVKELKDGEGMWFENCSSIHCFFMKMPIDVVYCDKNYRIVGIEMVTPWKIGHLYKGAKHVLEVKAGGAKELQVGDVLILKR